VGSSLGRKGKAHLEKGKRVFERSRVSFAGGSSLGLLGAEGKVKSDFFAKVLQVS
jgi:hypothetical protein